jgi:hypothetical protein
MYAALSYYLDAVDRETKERRLSVNRAKSVFLYLMNKTSA